MLLEEAKRAGALANAIEERKRFRAAVELALQEEWRVVDLIARNPQTNDQRSLITSELTLQTSKAGLAFVKTLYDAEIAALEADLAAIGATAPAPAPAPEPAPAPAPEPAPAPAP